MDIPTHKKLQELHKQKLQAQKLAATPQYLKSIQDTPRKPAIEDFILRKIVKLDPRDPDDNAKTVIETNCKAGPHCKCEATFCYDEKAYKDFERIYKSQMQAHKAELDFMTANPLQGHEIPQTLDAPQLGVQQESIDDFANVRDPYIDGLSTKINPATRAPAKKNPTPNAQSQVTVKDAASAMRRDPNRPSLTQAPQLEGEGTQLYIKQTPEKYSEEGVRILEGIKP